MKSNVFTTDDGARIAYDVHGNGPLDIVLIHGWGGSAASWQPVLEHLDMKMLRAICVSLRGHGLSSRWQRPPDLDHLSRDILNVADDAESKQFVSAGFSSGGKVATLAAQRSPDRIIGQVLIGAIAPEPYCVEPATAESWCDVAGNVEVFLRLIPSYTHHPIPRDRFEPFLKDFEHTPREALQMMLDIITEEFPVSTDTIPTLVIGASHDVITTPDYLREKLVRRFPAATLQIIDSGHWMPFEAPQELAIAMQGFLTRFASTR